MGGSAPQRGTSKIEFPHGQHEVIVSVRWLLFVSVALAAGEENGVGDDACSVAVEARQPAHAGRVLHDSEVVQPTGGSFGRVEISLIEWAQAASGDKGDEAFEELELLLG